MPAPETVTPPLVSIIVPARNEEESLRACLESLVAQEGISFELIVIDDGSTDRTREIAEAFLRSPVSIRIVDPPPLPQGWVGKNNAMTAGAKEARGKWFLFTDADTVHRPGSLVKAVAEAEDHHAEMLSYSPQQEVHGFWQKAVMPVIFAELAVTFRPSQVSDAKTEVAAANGQYILISKDAYEAVGGHAAIATDLLEDVALARIVKRSGRKIFFRYAPDAAHTRMYRSFAQLKEGWTKNLAVLFPQPQKLAAKRLTEFVLIIGSIAIAVFGVLNKQPETALPASLIGLVTSGYFFRRIAKAHFAVDSTILAVFGLPVFAYLLIRSALFHKKGGVVWKGRRYEPNLPRKESNLKGSNLKMRSFMPVTGQTKSGR